ncbi:MAG: hypothetical protein DMG06_16290 [Acidobacteria bacterium]|nr:MAG: hypothetical protein DMG06_16290 [Acidobacteriota bacterium]
MLPLKIAPVGPETLKKFKTGGDKGGRGSRRASWDKDLLGRWLARRLALPGIGLQGESLRFETTHQL